MAESVYASHSKCDNNCFMGSTPILLIQHLIEKRLPIIPVVAPSNRQILITFYEKFIKNILSWPFFTSSFI
jgi:hypothetical protein